MKKISLIIALLVVEFSTVAAPRSSAAGSSPYSYGEPFIFVERNVEFAVYPDGQFDFLYNPRGIKLSRINPHLNMSYNAGYNYDPFVQYDDYGAVVQIESVPVYYDYYGRIIQAGSVFISYNSFGRISRIGNLHVHYNPYNQYTHYSGYINRYNHRYIPRPWHHFYRPPYHQYSIVYGQPYRAYYYPTRIKYSSYKNYYKKNYNQNYRNTYYRPGDNIVVYNRGSRTEGQRDIRDSRSDYSAGQTDSNVRSNRNTDRDRTSNVRSADNSSRSTTTARRATVNDDANNSRAVRTRTESVPTQRQVERAADTPVKVNSNERVPVERSIRRDTKSSTNVQRVPAQPEVKRAETVIRSSGTPANTNEKTSTSRSSRGRG